LPRIEGADYKVKELLGIIGGHIQQKLNKAKETRGHLTNTQKKVKGTESVSPKTLRTNARPLESERKKESVCKVTTKKKMEGGDAQIKK